LDKHKEGFFHNIHKLNIIFALSSIALLLSVLWLIWYDYARDWKEWQRKFIQIESGGGNTGSSIRNLPLIDFLNPSMKIKQIVLPDLQKNINFTAIPRVDRCGTCHLALDRKEYAEREQPFRSHPRPDLYLSSDSPHPQEKFGCTICHQGRGRGTSFLSSAHTPKNAAQRRLWEYTYGWKEMEYWEEPMLPLQYIEASCAKCHKGVLNVPEAEKLNRGRFLAERSGCHGCHKIEKDGDLPKPGPPLNNISGKLEKEWAYNWIKEPHQFTPNTPMPHFFHHEHKVTPERVKRSLVEIESITEYLFSASAKKTYTLPPLKGSIEKGRSLVSLIGCKGCHILQKGKSHSLQNISEFFGPDLSYIGPKVKAGWLYHWLKNPKVYFPEGKMPDFRLSDQEAFDITTYLMTLGKVEGEKLDVPDTDMKMLDSMVREIDEKNILEKGRGGKGAEIMNTREKKEFLGKRLIKRYGCAGCHEMNGFDHENLTGAELTKIGTKKIHKFDFGPMKGKIENRRYAWLFQKMIGPRIFDRGLKKDPDVKLKMPDYHMNDEDAEAIVTYLLSLTDERIPLERQSLLTRSETDIEK